MPEAKISFTQPPRGAARAAGLVLIAFLAWGLVSTLAGAACGLDLFPAGIRTDAVLDGSVMRNIADRLSLAQLPRTAAKIQRAGGWALMRDFGPQVGRGCDGWLFLTEEFQLQTPADAARFMEYRERTVLQIHKSLQRRGITLIILMVPDKSRVEKSRLCRLTRPGILQGRLQDWIGHLQEGGVDVVDALPALQSLAAGPVQPYYRTDTHWNEAGAQAAVALLTAAVFKTGVTLTPRRDYLSTSLGNPARTGDLLRLAGLDALWPIFQPRTELSPATSIVERQAALGNATADLFGDGDLPTLALVGTSFSRNANFVPFLSQALHTPVASFAHDGGNFLGSARKYFQSAAFRENPPKLVIWEIPERTLQLPTDAYSSITFSPP